MSKRHNSMVRLAAVALCLFGTIAGISTARASDEGRLTSTVSGYSVVVPEGWERSSEDVVRELSSGAAPGVNAPVYEAALQPKNSTGSTVVGIQVIEYSRFGLNGPFTEAQKQAFVKEVSGLDLNSLAKDSLKPELSSQVNGARIVSTNWDAAKQRLIYDFEMEVTGAGKARVSCAVYFGKKSIVQVTFSTLADEWSNHWTACGQIFESFRFEQPGGITDNGPVAFKSPYKSLFNNR